MPQLSLVVSVYNEEESLDRFHSECSAILLQSGLDAEIIFVNDGSRDSSSRILEDLARKDPRVRVLEFTRNFGHEAAMIAGMDHAGSEVVICLDADLQHPPHLIPLMYEKYLAGHDIVNMARAEKKYRFSLKALTADIFYRLINALSPVDLVRNASDFFLVSGDVLRDLQRNYRERTRFVRGMVQWLGVNKCTLPFEPVKREAGQSKYSFRKLFRLSFVAIASLSRIPLQLGLIAGVLFGVFSIFLGLYSLVMYFAGETPPGYTTLILFLSIAFSLQFFMIGIIGVYVGMTFEETKQRPLYVLKEKEWERMENDKR